MTYQLKTTGIAANCTMLIAVDPDDGVIKDFASASVTSTMTVGANVDASNSDTWDGNTRRYFTLGSGTTSADYIAFGANQPLYAVNTGLGISAVWIGQYPNPNSGHPRFFGENSSQYVAGRNLAAGGSTHPAMTSGYGHNYGAISGLNAAPASGAKVLWGYSLTYGTNVVFYTALHDAASMTKTTNTAGSWSAASVSLGYVGRRDDSTEKSNEKIHALALFNVALTEAEWDSLRDDWFTVLLEPASGGGSAVGAASHYYRQLQG